MENTIENSPISIGRAFAILGILLALTIPASIVTAALLKAAPAFKSWITMLGYVLQFAGTIAVVYFVWNLRVTDLGKIKLVLFPLALVITFSLSIISESLCSLIPMPDFVARIFNEAISLDFAGYLTVGIAAPVLEELVFRGIILAALLHRYEPRKAIIWSAVIFGIAHLNPWQFIAAFIIGCAIGWLFWRTRSIWIGIFMHWANNTVGFILGYYAGDMNVSVTDYFGGPTNYAIILIVCAIVTFGCVKAIQRIPAAEPSEPTMTEG
ncbi:MAG: CPBP family intramembrane metalloprotease [Salinivirgaceae bacterium]|nr:CPBP family intramembrane metalloprotease [Salinivirgaceae bacterium]